MEALGLLGLQEQPVQLVRMVQQESKDLKGCLVQLDLRDHWVPLEIPEQWASWDHLVPLVRPGNLEDQDHWELLDLVECPEL